MKEPIQVLDFREHIIKLYDEANYTFNSTDSSQSYDRAFISGEQNLLASLIGIKVYKDDELKSNCIIGSEGGTTRITKNSALIDNDSLIICCSKTVFRLTAPNLDLKWKTVSDSASCFGIYDLDNEDYIVHGEIEITRLNKDGQIIWQNSGRDIWVTAEGTDDFAVYEDYILATDWEYNRYKFDFGGKLLDEYKVEPNKLKQAVNIKPKKWWKLW